MKPIDSNNNSPKEVPFRNSAGDREAVGGKRLSRLNHIALLNQTIALLQPEKQNWRVITRQGFLALGMPPQVIKTTFSALIAKSTNNTKIPRTKLQDNVTQPQTDLEISGPQLLAPRLVPRKR